MSDTTASLRRKIAGARELQSVVRTMKAVAASSVGQYERSVLALADYYHAVELGLGACFRGSVPAPGSVRPHRKPRAPAAGAVVFGSDQGLVGRFNEVIAEHAVAALPAHAAVWAVGERVHGRLADAGVPLAGLFAVPGSVQGITPLVGQILLETETRRRSEDAELYLFYNRPVPGGGYDPASRRLLPLDEDWRHALAALAWPTAYLPQVMGSGAAALKSLIRDYLFVSIFRACAESLASEHASRLAAMQRADKNIEETLDYLDRTFHRVRQSGIDAELFDVISGFEALGREER